MVGTDVCTLYEELGLVATALKSSTELQPFRNTKHIIHVVIQVCVYTVRLMVAFTVDQSDDSFLDLRAKIYLAHRSHGTEKVADLTISWKVRTRHFGLKDD